MWKISLVILASTGLASILFVNCVRRTKSPEVTSVDALQRADSKSIKTKPVDQHFQLQMISVFHSPSSPSRPLQSMQILHQEDTARDIIVGNLKGLRRCVHEEYELTGSALVTLNLEIDAKGGVVGGSTRPKGGLQAWSAVATCVLSQARLWKFNARSTPGRTVLIVPFGF